MLVYRREQETEAGHDSHDNYEHNTNDRSYVFELNYRCCSDKACRCQSRLVAIVQKGYASSDCR